MYLPNNRGMFLESLLNYTIQNILIIILVFFKRPVNIIPLEKYQHLITKVILKQKLGVIIMDFIKVIILNLKQMKPINKNLI